MDVHRRARHGAGALDVAARPALEVQGAAQLRRALKRAGLDVQDLKDAHKQVADMVARRSAQAVPRRTGRLAASVRTAGTASAAIVRAGRASVPYAGVIHWGWPGHHITAQPWISEAAERSQHTWEGIYLQAVEQIIDTVERTTTP